MTVASGTRPYDYSRYPFELQNGENIGYSGILFEEAMFAVLADRDIIVGISGEDRHYYKYLSNALGSSGKIAFEPTPTGGHLDGSALPIAFESGNDKASLPGCVNLTDYIIDMRNGLVGLWDDMAENDSDFSSSQIKEAYIKSIDDTRDDWVHSSSELGASGALFDIDLREVQWQPLLRFAKYINDNGYVKPKSPICPSFQTTAGNVISVTSRDLVQAANLPGTIHSGYLAANNNRIAVYGDGFTITTEAFYFDMWSDLKAAGMATFSNINDRALHLALNAGAAEITPKATSSGMKRLFLYDTSADVTPSSLLSFWPLRDDSQLTGFNASRNTKAVGGTTAHLSGLQIFNDYFGGVVASGISVISPVNGELVWTRFADMQEWSVTGGSTVTGNWSTNIPIGYNGSEIIYYGFINTSTSPTLWDVETYVIKYNPVNGNFQSSTLSSAFSRSDTFNDSSPGAIDTTNHSPATGESVALYTLLPNRQGNDDVSETIIWDGSAPRGTIFSNQPASTSPNPYGTCNGEIFGKNPGDSTPQYWHMRIEASAAVFPLPASSGYLRAGSFEMDGGRYKVVYDTPIAHDFEQPTFLAGDTNLTITSRLIQPEGDLDIGDGSALITFNAKPKGQSNVYTYMGRIVTATSGSEDQLQIIEYWGPIEGSPTHVNSV